MVRAHLWSINEAQLGCQKLTMIPLLTVNDAQLRSQLTMLTSSNS